MREHFKEHFKAFSNILKKLLKNAKKSYFSNLFHTYKTDIKKTWSTIKILLNKNHIFKKSPNRFKFNNEFIEGDKNIAAKFNEYFVNIGKKLTSNEQTNSNTSIEYFLKGDISTSFNFSHVNCKEVSEAINNLKNKKR